MYLIMLRACIFESSFSAVYAKLIKKSRVILSSTGSLAIGSALSIAIIVGGMPADLLSIVLKFSVAILSNAYLSIFSGND